MIINGFELQVDLYDADFAEHYEKALELIRKAVQMDPGNPDYQRAQRQFQRAGTEYREEGQAQGFSMGFMDPGTICCGLCFAQMICRMFMPYF